MNEDGASHHVDAQTTFAQASKGDYETPTLAVVGDFRELTLAVPTGLNGSDLVAVLSAP